MKTIKSILELVRKFPNDEVCLRHLEQIRWKGNVVSPFDETSTVYKCKNNLYRCRNTGKYFNAKTGTLFDNTKISLQKWFMAIWLITCHKKGISSLQLATDIDVTQKTAWFMLQRIRKCFNSENNNLLDNFVEIDETYIGGENKNRHLNKRVEGSQGRSTKDKVAVLGMVERNGKLNASVIPNAKAKTLTAEVIKYVKATASVYTDEWLGYKTIDKLYQHAVVMHNAGLYVVKGAYTNTIEGFWSLLKRGLIGIYHFTSKKHLAKYIDEFVFRYNTRDMDENSRFNLLLNYMGNKTTYKSLVAC